MHHYRTRTYLMNWTESCLLTWHWNPPRDPAEQWKISRDTRDTDLTRKFQGCAQRRSTDKSYLISSLISFIRHDTGQETGLIHPAANESLHPPEHGTPLIHPGMFFFSKCFPCKKQAPVPYIRWNLITLDNCIILDSGQETRWGTPWESHTTRPLYEFVSQTFFLSLRTY